MTMTLDRPVSSVAASFERDGYYVARQLLSAAEISEILEAFMLANKDGPVEKLSDIRSDFKPEDPLSFYPRMMHPHTFPNLPVGPVAEKFMLDRRIEAVLKECMGEQPIAVQSMFYFKPPGARGQTLHQDNYYLQVRPKTCCAAWIAVDDADAANGGMMVVPGTQKMDIVCPDKADMTTSFTTDYVAVPAGLEAVAVDLKAGDVLFFNGSLIHGSTPNTSKDRYRRSLINHYVPEGTEAMGKWYHHAIRTFDGSIKQIEVNGDGGPCGTGPDSVTSPH